MSPRHEHDALKDLRAAREAAAKLTAAERTLRDKHAALVAERQHTWSALVSREETLANAARLVDEASARWQREHAPAWVRTISGTREIRVHGLGTAAEREREVRVPPRLPDLPGLLSAPGVLTLDALCGLAPSVVRESLAAMIAATPDDRFGLPDEARQRRLAELDAAIAEVESQHAELCDGAAEAGLVLELLAPVRQRREAEARQQERERELAAARATA
jgi:hypothetical protein